MSRYSHWFWNSWLISKIARLNTKLRNYLYWQQFSRPRQGRRKNNFWDHGRAAMRGHPAKGPRTNYPPTLMTTEDWRTTQYRPTPSREGDGSLSALLIMFELIAYGNWLFFVVDY